MLAVQTALPDSRLRPFVRLYVQRDSSGEGPELTEPVVARLGTMLEFQFADPYLIPSYASNQMNPCPRITVIGPVTYRRVRLLIRGRVQALSVLFRPFGFHSLFGIPVSPLAEKGTEGHAVLGPAVSTLNEQLGNAGALSVRTQLLDEFFLARIGGRAADRSTSVLENLLVAGPLSTVSETARQACLSTRQLERIALRCGGVSPKMLTRIARFQRALKLKAEGESSWTNVAHAADYHDQMHMIHDFRTFAGDTPAHAFKQIAPGHLVTFT